MKPDDVARLKQTVLGRASFPAARTCSSRRLFDLEWAGEQMVGDRPTVAIKVSGQGIVGMKIYFDSERGLPIKSEATSRPRAAGDSIWQRVFSDYREFDGIQVATKIECKTDIAWLRRVEHIKEFKILDKVPADTFAEPK